MKHSYAFAFLPLTLFITPFSPKEADRAVSSYQTKAFNKEALDLSDSTEEEIKSYYNYDAIKDQSGSTRRKSLYDIISKDNTFVSYDKVTDWYKITDRNVSLSQPIDPSTYKFADDDVLVDGKPVFYETRLYFKDNSTPAKQINTNVNKRTSDASVTAIDWSANKRPKTTDGINNPPQVDKEHVWVKSHGFSVKGNPTIGAGTDLHHLIAADHNTNNVHNDLYYGEVADKSNPSTKTVYCVYADGTSDISGWTGKTALGEDCFEPTDQWKGNIARALLYRGVRYSNYQDKNEQKEPYLLLTDDITKKDDIDNWHGVFHNLSTFLKWNKEDPVDEYEIHRNNRIYKNVQNNRNPFVDFPEWADKVYNPSSVPEEPKGDTSGTEKPSETPKPDTGTSGDKTSSPSSSEGSFGPLSKLTKKQKIILVCAVAIAVILLLILFIAISKKKKQKPKKQNYNKKKTKNKKK